MRVILIGNGGHSKVIQDMVSSIQGWELIAILDDKYESEFQKSGILHASISAIDNILGQNDFKVVVAIGNNLTRKKIVEKLNLRSEKFATLVHPTAVVSSTVTLGYGTVVMPNAVINADTVIGSHCIINTASIIEHENVISDYVHISPNATLTGNVFIGDGAHIGSSSVIIPGKNVKDWSVIGAGSTVIHDIPINSKAVGSPCKIIETIRM